MEDNQVIDGVDSLSSGQVAATVEDVIEKLADPPIGEPQDFDASFFSNRSGKYLDLIKQDSEPLAFTTDGVNFPLSKPAYVSGVSLNGGEKIEPRKLKIEYLPVGINPHWKVAAPVATDDPAICFWEVAAFISRIRVTSVAGRLSFKQRVKRMEVCGYPEEDLRALEESVRYHEQLREATSRHAQQKLKEIKDSEVKLGDARKAFAEEKDGQLKAIKAREEEAENHLAELKEHAEETRNVHSEGILDRSPAK